VVVEQQGGQGGAEPEPDAILDYDLMYPERLKNVWFLPIGLALFFAVPVYLPTYSRGVLLFAALVCLPPGVCCFGLSIWARRNQLTGDREADTVRILDATGAQLLLTTLAAPAFTMLCLLVGLSCLLSVGLIGLLDYDFLSLLAIFGIVLCLFLPEERLRMPTDWLRKTLDESPWDWLLGTKTGCYLVTALAFAILFFVGVAMGFESEGEYAALLLGPGCLVGGFLLVPFTSKSYHKWKRFNKLRESSTLFIADGYLTTTAGFIKNRLPIWCVQCDKQGFIFVDDVEQPYFVVCKRCGWETSEVFCPKCVIGGEFVEDVGKRPKSWKCPDCGTEYDLPESFYDEPVPLYLEEDL
jgi:hypothetical protein